LSLASLITSFGVMPFLRSCRLGVEELHENPPGQDHDAAILADLRARFNPRRPGRALPSG
jgi:hypothetical protein